MIICLLVLGMWLALGSAQATTLFAVMDANGNITRTSEVDASSASVPQDGSCKGCVVIAPTDPRLIAFRAAQNPPAKACLAGSVSYNGTNLVLCAIDGSKATQASVAAAP